MGDEGKPAIGSIGWIDLTVESAPQIRDFYASVVGWKAEDTDMGRRVALKVLLPELTFSTEPTAYGGGPGEVLPTRGAPKGRDIPAQGNALGLQPDPKQSPERARHTT